MKPHRGHYRPLFGVGVGRSPPFLVAALTIGLCILAVSYWRLALQYHDLEEQLKRLIQKRDSLEANQNFINKQLEIREENFSEAKVSLQKKEQEVLELKKKQDQTGKELGEIKASLDLIKQSNDKFKSDSAEKERNLELLRTQNKVLEEDKKKLDGEVKDLKAKLSESIKNKNSSPLQQQQAQPQKYQKPESADKDPVYSLVNKIRNAVDDKNAEGNNKDGGVLPPPVVVDSKQQQPAPPQQPESGAHNPTNQIAPPPEPPKSSDSVAAQAAAVGPAPVVEDKDKMKAQESKLIPEVVDPDHMMMGDDADIGDKEPETKLEHREGMNNNNNGHQGGDIEIEAKQQQQGPKDLGNYDHEVVNNHEPKGNNNNEILNNNNNNKELDNLLDDSMINQSD